MDITVKGARIHYDIGGDPYGRRVLLLHGWGCNGDLMRPVADGLSNVRWLILDFPGHGKSSLPPETWGVPEYAACLKEFLDNTDFFPCDVIAHSFGCRVVTVLAAQHTELFRKIILTGAAGLREETNKKESNRTQQYRLLKRIVNRVSHLPGLSRTAEVWQEQLIQHYGSSDYRALAPEMRGTFVRIVNQDLAEYMPLIRQPVLLIFGDQDTATPLEFGKRMEKLIPDAGLVVLNGSHFVYLEQLPAFIRIVQHFLSEES